MCKKTVKNLFFSKATNAVDEKMFSRSRWKLGTFEHFETKMNFVAKYIKYYVSFMRFDLFVTFATVTRLLLGATIQKWLKICFSWFARISELLFLIKKNFFWPTLLRMVCRSNFSWITVHSTSETAHEAFNFILKALCALKEVSLDPEF